jgi:hypothetical protein
MAQRTFFCLLNVLKKTGEFDEAMFQGVQMKYELIFCILGFEKSDWDEVA